MSQNIGCVKTAIKLAETLGAKLRREGHKVTPNRMAVARYIAARSAQGKIVSQKDCARMNGLSVNCVRAHIRWWLEIGKIGHVMRVKMDPRYQRPDFVKKGHAAQEHAATLGLCPAKKSTSEQASKIDPLKAQNLSPGITEYKPPNNRRSMGLPKARPMPSQQKRGLEGFYERNRR